MKNKLYNIEFRYTATVVEPIVAKNRVEAGRIAKELLGEDIDIRNIEEIKDATI